MTWPTDRVLAQLFMLRMRAVSSNRTNYAALLSTIIERVEAQGV